MIELFLYNCSPASYIFCRYDLNYNASTWLWLFLFRFFLFFLDGFFSCLIFHCGVVALMSQYREMMLLFIVSCSVHHHRVSGRRQVFALHNKQWEFVRLRDNSSLWIQDQSQLDITSNSMSFCMVVFNRKMRRCFLIILVFLQDMILCILQHVFCYSSYSCSYFFLDGFFFCLIFLCGVVALMS